MAEAKQPKGAVRRRFLAPFGLRRGARRADGTPASPKPTRRRLLRFALWGLAGVAIAVVGLWLAVLYMPLPASQVIPRVEAAIQERLGPGYAVDIADAEIHRGGDGVELRLVGLVITESGGLVVVSAPQLDLRLTGLGILGDEVGVRSVQAVNPKLDMRFDMAVGAASKNSDLPDRILQAVGDLDRLLGPDGAAGALEHVEVANATVLVAPRARAAVSLEGVDLRLSRGAGGSIALTASSARPGDRWTTAITVSAPTAEKDRTIDLGIENIDLAPYSAPFAEKAGAPPLAGRVSGHLNARIGAAGRLEAGEGRLDMRGLLFSMSGGGADKATARQIGVDGAQLALSWDPALRQLNIKSSQIAGSGGQMSFSGALAAPPEPGKPWTARISGRDVLLAGETPEEAPLRLDRVEVEASFDPVAGVLEIGKCQLIGPTASAAINALVRFEGASPAIKLGVLGSMMPASAVKRLWPFFLAKSTREWIVENVASGRVETVELTIDVASGALAALQPFDPLPEGSMSLAIVFKEGVLRGRVGMPWIEGAAGRVDATARTVDVRIDQAFIAGLGDEGPVGLSNAHFSVPSLVQRHPPATLTVKADGSLRRALTLLQSGTFGSNPVPKQLDVSKVTGRVIGDIQAGFTLGDPDQAPPSVKATAEMRDVRIAGVFSGRNFEKGAFQLKVGDDAPPALTGKGVISGAPATVAITQERPNPAAAPRRKLSVTLTADAADLTRLGLDVPGSLKGAIPLAAELQLDEPSAPMAVKADLVNVGIDGLIPGFQKPAGRPGKLGFLVEKSGEKTIIRDFALEAGDRGVRGVIEFGAKGELLAATLPIYRPGPGDDAKVEIDKTRGGGTAVAVQGASLDLKPFLDAARGKGGTGGSVSGSGSSMPKSLDVTAKLGTGLGYGGEAVAGLDLKLTMRDGKVVDADGTGRIGAGAIKLATGDSGRVSLAGGDAGAFLRFADVYGRIDGGAFDLSAGLAAGPGTLRIKSFSVRNDTTLDRARRAADRGDEPASRGAPTRFDEVKVQFVRSGGSINVSEAVVYGPQYGATLEGVVNYAADRVDLVGTFVPIYGLNNLFGRMPIIGELLGGKHGGLVGVTFQVKGSTSAPTVTVNPLSAVAPGFLRKMFEFRQGDGVAQPAAPSASRPPNQP